MSEQLALLPDYLTAHLQLSLSALLLGACISVPLGVLVTRRVSLEAGVLGVAGVVQTVPSLALLAIMVPLLGAIGVALGVEISSIGFLPALIALTLYSILPILRNTVTGIAGVDPALREAALGVGMTSGQQLLRVELPLALPVIVAGLRTATVWVVGTATLSTPVGATSLGNYIFAGLQTRNQAAVLVGCVAAAGLALLLDALIRGLEVGLRERRQVVTAVSLGILLLLGAGTLGVTLASRRGDAPAPVRIGSKTFTEQYILAEVLAETVRRETGRGSSPVPSLGSTVLFDALRQDQIDLYVDYSGTIWATLMKRETLPDSRDDVLREVGTWLRERHGIELVAALGFENTYALGMRAVQAERLGITRIGQLAPVAPRLEIGGDYEFFARPEWTALEAAYGLRFRQERSMDSALMYQAVAGGEVDVISAFSTDGRISAYGIRLLEDEKGVVPPYDAIVLASPGLVARRPEVVQAIRKLAGSIDEATMQGLNRAVDEAGETPEAVGRRFVAERTRAGSP